MIVINRLLGLIMGLALLAAGVIVTAETALSLSGRAPWLIDRAELSRELARLTWSDPRVLPVSIALLAAGVVLVIAQLKPRRPATLPLRESTEQRRARIERRSVETRLAWVARNDDEVAAARARVGRRRAKIKTTTVEGAEPLSVQDRIGMALINELKRLGLDHHLKIRTRS